ncbi:MAG: LCP family protein [Peptococcaceae bacterium]|nr:LCP family protein [Peptococcaceae bacterium]
MRKRYRLKNVWRLAAVLAVFFALVWCGYQGSLYLMEYLFGPPPAAVGENSADEDPKVVLPSERLNLLVLGMDRRQGEEFNTRCDTIMFVSADPKKKQVAVLSIPRDTRVNIPGYGYDKINAATVYGGPELLQQTVEEFLDLPVDYYVVTDFQGFENIVDILGGVTINVEQRMYYAEGPNNNVVVDLYPGEQRLNGKQALGYVRYRGYEWADITRTEKQQKFLRALAGEVMQASTITKIPSLIKEINKCVETNLSLKEMLRWGALARNMEQFDMVTATLPGYPITIDGLSYWYLEPSRAHEVAVNLMNGEKVASHIEPPPPNSIAWRYIREAEEKEKEASGQDAAGTGTTTGGQVALDNAAKTDNGNDSPQPQAGSGNDGDAGQPEGGGVIIIVDEPAGPEQDTAGGTQNTGEGTDGAPGQSGPQGDTGTAAEGEPSDTLLPQPDTVQTG